MVTTRTRGEAAETMAVEHLTSAGYRIIDRNYRTNEGEVDVIAYDGDVLCFVEVRSLADPAHGDPLETIGPAKIRCITQAARAYLGRVPTPWPAMRFDAVGVTLTDPPRIALVRDAFDADPR
jgi:putative endonuclease